MESVSVPLDTRGSIFDERRENGILIGYVKDESDRSPVLEILRRDGLGKITRTRYTMNEVMQSLGNIRHER